MKMPLKIFNICAIFILAFLFFISFTWIGYTYEGTKESLREAVTSTLSFLGVLATLTAAYVASRLFNDWRDQHNKSIRNQFSIDAYNKFSALEQSITLCSFKTDTLQDSITYIEYHIYPGQIPYSNYVDSIQDIFDSLNLIKLNFTDYLNLQRANGAVSGRMEKTKVYLDTYVAKFSSISKTNVNSFEHVQDFINQVHAELLLYTELSTMIYESDIQEMLEDLQVL